MIKKGILLLTTAIFMSSPMLSAMEKDEGLPSQPVKGQKQIEQSFILSAFPVDVWLNIAQRLPVRRAHAVLNATSSELRSSKDLWRRIAEKFFPDANLKEVYKGSDNLSVNAYRNLMQMAAYLFHPNRLVKAAHLMIDEQGNNKFINLINQTFKGNFAEILTARVLAYSGKTEEAFEIIEDLRERCDYYAKRWYEQAVYDSFNINSASSSWIPEDSILNYIQDPELENFVGAGSRQRAMDFISKHRDPDKVDIHRMPNNLDLAIRSGDIQAFNDLFDRMQSYSRWNLNNMAPAGSSIIKFKAEQLLFMMELIFCGTYTRADWSKDEVWVEPKNEHAIDQGSQSSRVYHSDDETQPQDEDNN